MSPSGLHLGHYHALIKPHHIARTDPAFAEVEQQRLAILDLHINLLNYAMKHGYSLTRWQTIVNVMIAKEPGNSKIHRPVSYTHLTLPTICSV